MASTIKVGDKVRFSAKFLRSTGQIAGGEGQSVFTVLDIFDSFAVVDQELEGEWYSAEELAANPSLKYRRIALSNLKRVGTVEAD